LKTAMGWNHHYKENIHVGVGFQNYHIRLKMFPQFLLSKSFSLSHLSVIQSIAETKVSNSLPV
jgi:hypothetical protein